MSPFPSTGCAYPGHTLTEQESAATLLQAVSQHLQVPLPSSVSNATTAASPAVHCDRVAALRSPATAGSPADAKPRHRSYSLSPIVTAIPLSCVHTPSTHNETAAASVQQSGQDDPSGDAPETAIHLIRQLASELAALGNVLTAHADMTRSERLAQHANRNSAHIGVVVQQRAFIAVLTRIWSLLVVRSDDFDGVTFVDTVGER